MADVIYSDALIRDILTRYHRFAFVGASPNPSRPSYFAMKYLMAKGFHIIPVNPGHAGEEILGQKAYASLANIDQPVDVVDIFRSSDAALPLHATPSPSVPRWCGCNSACVTRKPRHLPRRLG